MTSVLAQRCSTDWLFPFFAQCPMPILPVDNYFIVASDQTIITNLILYDYMCALSEGHHTQHMPIIEVHEDPLKWVNNPPIEIYSSVPSVIQHFSVKFRMSDVSQALDVEH